MGDVLANVVCRRRCDGRVLIVVLHHEGGVLGVESLFATNLTVAKISIRGADGVRELAPALPRPMTLAPQLFFQHPFHSLLHLAMSLQLLLQTRRVLASSAS